jgi:hypothetical protein
LPSLRHCDHQWGAFIIAPVRKSRAATPLVFH